MVLNLSTIFLYAGCSITLFSFLKNIYKMCIRDSHINYLLLEEWVVHHHSVQFLVNILYF